MIERIRLTNLVALNRPFAFHGSTLWTCRACHRVQREIEARALAYDMATAAARRPVAPPAWLVGA